MIEFGGLKIDPVEIGSTGNAILGIRGSGKTSTATYLAEQMHAAGIPFIAFDPIGVFRFLRVPGKGPGIPVVVAGGEGGDLPLTVASAPAIVEAAMQSGVSLVIDLYDMHLSKADWRRIVRDCVRLLLHRNKAHGMRHVFIEEAAEFAPQKVTDGLVYAEMEKLARMGGNAQLGYTLINQRSEEVNKALLELCDNLFLHRQKGRNSLTALTKWLDVGAVKGGKAIIDTLATLPTGECWAWLAQTDRPVRVKVPLKNSLYPSRKVMHGADLAVIAKAVDVGAFVSTLKAALPAIEEKAKEDDPRHLQTVIAGLRKELRERGTPGEARPVDAESLNAEYRRGHADGSKHAADAFADWIEPRRMAAKQLLDLLNAGRKPEPTSIRPGDTPWVEIPDPRKYMEPRTSQLQEQPPIRAAKPTDDTDLPGNGIGLLKKICELYPVKLTWGQVTALLGRKARGGTFNHQRKVMLERGLVVESSDIVTPTAAGFALAGVAQSSTELPPAKLRELWQGVLPDPAGRMFAALTRRGKGWHHLSVIAQDLGMAGTGGHWNNGIATLRRNGLAEMQGKESIRLAGWLL